MMYKFVFVIILNLLIISDTHCQTLINGNFAATNSGWTATGDFYYDATYPNCLSCPGYAYLSTPTGGTGSNLGGDISQTISIPSNATSATLTFYTYIGTFETSVVKDYLSAYFIYGSAQWYNIATLTNLDYSAGYIQHTYSIPSNLGLYGIPLTLYFEGTTDNTSAGTKFRLDDVSLTYTTSSCTFSLSAYSTSVGSGATSGNFSVITQSGCPWSASSNDPSWLHTSSSNTGTGTCSYTVDANSGAARNGTISVGTNTYTVYQAGTSCTFSLSAYSTSVGSGATSGNFSVITQSGCPWSASSNDPSWLHTSSSNTGTGTCSYTVDANSGAARNGTISVGTNTYTVYQAGTSCTYSLSAYSTSVGSGATSGNFSVTTQSGCPWSATSNDPAWLHTSSSNTGTGTCSYTVDDNFGSARTGSISVGGYNFIVDQAGVVAPTFLDISDVRIFANNILLSSGNTWIVSGNVYAVPRIGCATTDQVLHFTGNTIFVDLNNNTITAANGTVYCTGIGSHGTVNLFNGLYNLHAVGTTLFCSTFDLANTLFKLSYLNLEFNSIETLCDGIRIDGDLSLPDVLTYFSTSAHLNINLNSLYLKTTGIDLAGSLNLSNLRVSNDLNLETLNLNYDSNLDEFNGQARLHTPAFNINADAAIRNGQLDEVGLGVAGDPVPIFSTGLAIDSVGGGLQNISTPPLNLYLGARLSPYSGFTISSLANLRIQANYRLGTSFNAWGNFSLFNQNVANTGFTVSPGLFELSGDIDLMNILIAHSNMSVSNYTGYTKLRGNFNANLQVPQISFPSWLSWINSFYTGITLASTSNYLTNDYLAGTGKLLLAPRLFYTLGWNNGWAFDFGGNSSILPLEAQSEIGPFRLSQPYSIYSFDLNTVTENIIVTGKGSSVIPQFTLYLTNGDSVNAGNFLIHSNSIYISDSINNLATIIIHNPPLGNYFIHNLNADSLFVSKINQPPSISIQSISNDPINKLINVNFNTSDPDNNATIQFGLDNDKENANGLILVDSIVENGSTGSILLDYSRVKTGKYYVYALIKDSIGQTQYEYFNQSIEIISNGAPNPPSGLTVTGTANSLIINFNKNNTVPLNYNIRYSTKQNSIDNTSNGFAIGDTNQIELTILPPGKYYEFVVSAIDTSGNESGMSNTANITWIASGVNNWPKFSTAGITTKAHIGINYNCQIPATDADNDPLIYSITSGPQFATIDNIGTINWTPTSNDIGFNQFYIRVEDNNGGYDSIYYEVLVIDSASNFPNMTFNQASFYDYSANGIITISDPEITTDDNIDSVVIHLYSTSDQTGLNILGHHSYSGSSEFIADFNLSATLSLGSAIYINPGDTIWAEYTSTISNKKAINYSYFNLFEADMVSLDTVCGTDSVKFYSFSKGNNLNYTWNFGDGSTISNVKNPKHIFPSYFGAGNDVYQVRLLIFNDEGMIDSTNKSIVILRIPDATFSISTTGCDSAILTAHAAIGIYNWSTSDTSRVVSVFTSNNYSLNVTSSAGCSNASYQYIELHDSPSPSISGSLTFCDGNSTSLNSNSGYSVYNWSTNETTQVITVNNPGLYSVTVTDSFGCHGHDSVTVTMNPLPHPVIVGDTMFCRNGFTTLDAGNGYLHYYWSNSESSQSIDVNTPGIYSVVVTDLNGCIDSTNKQIIESPYPDTTISVSGFELTSNAIGARYQWIYCDGTLLNGDTLATFLAPQDTAYAVIVNQAGCVDTSACETVTGVGIQTSFNNTISIYPNPVVDDLIIKISGHSIDKFEIFLKNTLGQIVHKYTIATNGNSTEFNISMSDLAKGIYYLSVESNGFKNVYNIIRQ